MSTISSTMAFAAAGFFTLACNADGLPDQTQSEFEFGRIASAEEIARADIDVRFDGLGLPPGRGSVTEGTATYNTKCAACHGSELEGNPALGVRPLISDFRHSVNNLPYAPPLFAYIRRAMPLTAPRSLSDNEVYGLVAFLLSRAGINTTPDLMLDAAALAAIEMPNRENFAPQSDSGVALPESSSVTKRVLP